MKLQDQRDIEAPREAVWAGITDPETLRRCIPGCQSMTGSVEEGFEATVVQKVGPVKATFKGAVTLHDVVEGESCLIRGEGKGGPAGFAKGDARIALSEIPEGTRLAYEVDAKVGGKLAQLGGRVIDGVAGRMSDQFFDEFKRVVEEPAAPPQAPETAAHAAAIETAAPQPAAPQTAAPETATTETAAPETATTGPAAPEPAGAGAEPKKKGILGRLFG